MNNHLDKKHYSIIDRIFKNDCIPHAILFEVDDCEKIFSFIKQIVKLILCKDKNKNLSTIDCGKCNICSLIDLNNYPDLVVIKSDGNWIKKSQLVDLKEEFNNKSLLDNKMIYIINEAEKLNVSSSNSLLKFLEEPEEDIIAILLTTNRYLLLDTILSRCQIFCLKDFDYEIDNESLDRVECLIEYFIKQKNLFVDYKYLLDNIFVDKNTTSKLLSDVSKYFLCYLNNINSEALKDSKIYNDLNKVKIDQIILYVKIIESEVQKLEYNINFKIWLDGFFVKIIGDVYD